VNEVDGRAFRAAWIKGVRAHYPGEPKPGYVAPWDDIPQWEQQSTAAVYGQIQAFVVATDGAADRLSREQKGRFVALCWIGQILRHFADPKPAYVADWSEMPSWQREIDADIFEDVSGACLSAEPSTESLT
jgi:hypothetical protein